MVDRFLVWFGTGVITAGVTAAMIAGAGVAVSDRRFIRATVVARQPRIVEFHWKRMIREPASRRRRVRRRRTRTTGRRGCRGRRAGRRRSRRGIPRTRLMPTRTPPTRMPMTKRTPATTRDRRSHRLGRSTDRWHFALAQAEGRFADDALTSVARRRCRARDKTRPGMSRRRRRDNTDRKPPSSKRWYVDSSAAKLADDMDAPEAAAVAFASAAEADIDATAAAPQFSGLLNLIGTDRLQPVRPGEGDHRRTTDPACEQQRHGAQLDPGPRLRLR